MKQRTKKHRNNTQKLLKNKKLLIISIVSVIIISVSIAILTFVLTKRHNTPQQASQTTTPPTNLTHGPHGKQGEILSPTNNTLLNFNHISTMDQQTTLEIDAPIDLDENHLENLYSIFGNAGKELELYTDQLSKVVTNSTQKIKHIYKRLQNKAISKNTAILYYVFNDVEFISSYMTALNRIITDFGPKCNTDLTTEKFKVILKERVFGSLSAYYRNVFSSFEFVTSDIREFNIKMIQKCSKLEVILLHAFPQLELFLLDKVTDKYHTIIEGKQSPYYTIKSVHTIKYSVLPSLIEFILNTFVINEFGKINEFRLMKESEIEGVVKDGKKEEFGKSKLELKKSSEIIWNYLLENDKVYDLDELYDMFKKLVVDFEGIINNMKPVLEI